LDKLTIQLLWGPALNTSMLKLHLGKLVLWVKPQRIPRSRTTNCLSLNIGPDYLPWISSGHIVLSVLVHQLRRSCSGHIWTDKQDDSYTELCLRGYYYISVHVYGSAETVQLSFKTFPKEAFSMRW